MTQPQSFWLEARLEFPDDHDNADGSFADLGKVLEGSGFRAVYDETADEYLLLSRRTD